MNLQSNIITKPGETIVEQTVRRITVAIRKGELTMGNKLPSEFELMEKLGVSRNSLREAMKILSAMGIVEIKRGDGTYLCDSIKYSFFDSIVNSIILDASSNEQIAELRSTLDSALMRLAIAKRTDEDIEKLAEYIRLMRQAFDAGDISLAAQYDYQFHLYIIQCCKNPFFARICETTYMLFEDSIERNIRTEAFFARAEEHHRDILACLKYKRYDQIDTIVEESLSTWRKNADLLKY